MADSALRQLEIQIEAVRKEAFQEGYAAAVAKIAAILKEGAPPTRSVSLPKTVSGTGNMIRTVGRKSARKRPRGANRAALRKLLQDIAPRAIGPTQMAKMMKEEKGIPITYSSTRNALKQLEESGTVREINNSKTWRYVGPTAQAAVSSESSDDTL